MKSLLKSRTINAIEKLDVSAAHFLTIFFHGLHDIVARFKVDFCFARMPSLVVEQHFAMKRSDGSKELRAKQNQEMKIEEFELE